MSWRRLERRVRDLVELEAEQSYKHLDRYNTQMAAHALAWRAGQLSFSTYSTEVDNWQKQVTRELRLIHLKGAAAGLGGDVRLTDEVVDRVETCLRDPLDLVESMAQRWLNAPPLDVADVTLERVASKIESLFREAVDTFDVVRKEWQEWEHPRGERGRFRSGSGRNSPALNHDGSQASSGSTLFEKPSTSATNNQRAFPRPRFDDEEKDARQRGRKPRGDRRGRSNPTGIDWEDPNVLEYYRAHAGASGADILSPRLLEHLLHYAQPGRVEFGGLINIVTGEVVQMVPGTRSGVGFNAHLMDSVDYLATVHTHDEDLAFSGQDWLAFVDTPNLDEELLVTPDAIYTLRKPPEFDPIPSALKGRTASDYWHQRKSELITSLLTEKAQIMLINKELADIHGVVFERSELIK